ncbi:Cof subfamily protein (haloacid dehalogenase superfamily) [Nocardioides sp. BE266]|uniref:HAD family hydrolase n=1 Tax=Nocardioides sp. BE266 TaxID=2817725 RepID=UPI0028580AE1|nr:HAD family hydrolase [Nocardioides sp. BE266]MDR7251496.1 Cof subfamily protein (haloacid dehalogenase superfamily) [Nocardioides sp. BE266]
MLQPPAPAVSFLDDLVPGALAGVRLVVSDLDGTLLAPDRTLPAGTGGLVAELRDAGIAFVPASGRAYASQAELFADVPVIETFIADNGAVVVQQGQARGTGTLDPALVHELVAAVREHALAGGRRATSVVCGVDTAWVEVDGELWDEALNYHPTLTRVARLEDVTDPVIKVAIVDLESTEAVDRDVLRSFANQAQVTRSGAHWADVTALGVTKGQALRDLQDRLGVGPGETVVFGDHLNDLEMFGEADHSFAVAHAQPEILDVARYRLPDLVDPVQVALRRIIDDVTGAA